MTSQGLRVLLDAIETMDQKITPYGEREDGTILHYIVADSTWHRILAAARSSEIYAALPPSAPPALDAERLAEALLVVHDQHTVRIGEFFSAQEAAATIAAEYARLQEQGA